MHSRVRYLLCMLALLITKPALSFEVALERTLDTPGRKISNVVFSPDAELLAGWDAEAVEIWETRTGRHLCTLKTGPTIPSPNGAGNGLTCVVFSPDRKTVATATGWVGVCPEPQGCDLEDYEAFSKGKVRVWAPYTGQLLHTLSHPKHGGNGNFKRLEFSPDGKLLAVPAPPLSGLWDVRTGTLKREVASAHVITFSPDGKLLLSGGWGKVWKLQDIRNGKLLWTLEGGTKVRDAAFSSDGRLLLGLSVISSPGLQWVNTIWDVRTGERLEWLTGNYGMAVFSPDGKRIVGMGKDDWYLYGTGDTKLKHKLDVSHVYKQDVFQQRYNDRHAYRFFFSPDSKILVAGISNEEVRSKRISFFNGQTGAPLYTTADLIRDTIPIALSSPINPNEYLLATRNDTDSALKLWRIKIVSLVREVGPELQG